MAEKHIVEVAKDGANGSFLARSYLYDAIILDYSLPKKDGLAVCREIRASGKSTPIVFLSVTGDTTVKVAALNYGADDYMTKPFALNELHARLRALNRRPTITAPTTITIGNLSINSDNHTAMLGHKDIYFTRKEFNILEYLMRHRGNVVTRAILMDRAWTAESDPLSNTIETHIVNLRKKLARPGKPHLIVTVPGRGYMIA